MSTTEITYSVRLRDYPEDLRAADRINIETRYAKELERAFGTADNVAAALETMQALEASPPDVLSPSDLSLIKQWGKASAAARLVALREVGDAEGCFFEVERVPF